MNYRMILLMNLAGSGELEYQWR